MLKILNVIFMCWTPADSLELATHHTDWVKTSEGVYFQHKFEETLIESWKIGDRKLIVVYQHPMVGERNLWCYTNEHGK